MIHCDICKADATAHVYAPNGTIDSLRKTWYLCDHHLGEFNPVTNARVIEWLGRESIIKPK